MACEEGEFESKKDPELIKVAQAECEKDPKKQWKRKSSN